MRPSSDVAIIATFTALIVGSDFALAGAVDVKLLDSMVFLASLLYGLRVGAAVAVLSETIWSFASPWGMAGMMAPFLVGGELIFALAGWAVSRVWGKQIRLGSHSSLFIGATMAICAFVWDFETNAASALLFYWPSITLQKLIITELVGGFFFLTHDVSDFLLGTFFVPAAIPFILKVFNRRV